MKKLITFLRRMSPFLWITYTSLFFGTVFLCTWAVVEGRPLLFFGIPLITLALASVVYKSHLSVIEVKRLRSVLTQRIDVALASKADRRPQRKASSGSNNSAKLPEQRILRALKHSENQQRLHSIGMYTPKVLDTSAKGRNAAAVIPDEQRSYRLYAATEGSLGSRRLNAEGLGFRKIAVIGTSPLRDSLEAQFEVTMLYPGIAEAVFDAESPSALVIEEAALETGAWDTTLSSTGLPMLDEVLAVRDRAVEGALQVYLLPSKRIDVSTHTLRDKATVVVDNSYLDEFDELQRDSDVYMNPNTVISKLVRYVNG